MATGTHVVAVWVGKGERAGLFTLTARNADGAKARYPEVKQSIEDAGFDEVHIERGLTKRQAIERKTVLMAEYKSTGLRYQKRNALPLPMM